MISVVIPTYNEQLVILDCVSSLLNQKKADFEIIVVDDGSTDDTVSFVRSLQSAKVKVYEKKHQGPGVSRNFGVSRSKGEIIVFCDSDMTFDDHYLYELTKPIVDKKRKGTFSNDEFVSNWGNVWARCWNYNQGIKSKKRIGDEYTKNAPVFRAILKTEFEKVGGFDPIGYTDDWTLSRKLGYKADAVNGAICYHKNPDSLEEVYKQASWIGKNEFMIKGFRKYINLIRYSFPISLIIGILISLLYGEIRFIAFKITYDFGVWFTIINLYKSNNLYK